MRKSKSIYLYDKNPKFYFNLGTKQNFEPFCDNRLLKTKSIFDVHQPKLRNSFFSATDQDKTIIKVPNNAIEMIIQTVWFLFDILVGLWVIKNISKHFENNILSYF